MSTPRRTLPRAPRRGRSVVLLVALSFLPACSMPSFLKVADPPDGVTVKNLTADIAFGADEPESPAIGPAQFASVPLAPLDELFEPDFEIDEGPRPRQFTAPPGGPCPDAEDGTYPEKAAGVVVEGMPTPGVYRWKETGTIELVVPPVKVPVSGLSTRTVRSVMPTASGFTYDYEQVTLAGREIQTIEIRTAESEPLRGVYLTRLRLFAPRNGRTPSREETPTIDFHPPSLLAPKLMTLPVQTEHIASTSVDVERKLTFTIEGDVDASTRVRIDACGELLDAWRFNGTLRLVQDIQDESRAIRSTKYDTLFAPQLGGLFVGDHVVTTGRFEAFQYTSDLATTIGGLTPAPEPKR